MSALDTLSTHDDAGVSRRIAHWAAGFPAGWRRRAEYRRTVRELQGLTNRELADIGLTRGEIRQVASTAVGGIDLR